MSFQFSWQSYQLFQNLIELYFGDTFPVSDLKRKFHQTLRSINLIVYRNDLGIKIESFPVIVEISQFLMFGGMKDHVYFVVFNQVVQQFVNEKLILWF